MILKKTKILFGSTIKMDIFWMKTFDLLLEMVFGYLLSEQQYLNKGNEVRENRYLN